MSAYGKVNQRLFDNGWSGLLSRSEAIDSLFKAQEHELARLREAGDALFEAMPKRSSIWNTFREENKRAMGEALEQWDKLRGRKFSAALSEQPEEGR